LAYGAMMRGRKPVPEFDHIMLEGNAREVQQHGSDIDFMASDITVLSQQPGLGKTHAVIEFCKNHPDKKILYLTTRHRLINEITKKLRGASHWYGFGHLESGEPKGCPKFLDPKVKKLDEADLRPHLICSVMGCDKERCRYRRQFKKDKLVFAPVEYINSGYIWNEEEFKFDICFIDESILKTEEINYDLDGYLKAIAAINQIVPFDYAKSPILERNYDQLHEIMPDIASDIDRALIQYANSARYDAINDINRLNIDKIYSYKYYDKIYRGKLEGCNSDIPIYYKPLSYKIFNISQSAPVVMLDASFEETLFRDHLEFFNYEYGFKKDLKVTIYQSNVRNPKSIIYRMHDTSAHPKVNFTNEKYREGTMLWVKHDLEIIHKIFGSENVGIITYKDLVTENICKKNRKEFLGFEAMSYGDLLGSNSFDGKKVLVILGTYDISPDQLIKEIYKHYLICYPGESITDARTMKEKHDKSYGDLKSGPWSLEGEDFTDGYRALWGTMEPPLDKLPYMISSAFGANEVYQALHRSRFLTNDVIIFAYCHLPGKILTEADIPKIDIPTKKVIFEVLEQDHGKPRTDMVKLGSIVSDIDEGLSPTDICRKYKIRDEDDKYDTTSVSGMKEVLKSCQNNL
jgi:hypothetical protein